MSSGFLFVARLRPAGPLEIELGAQIDRHVDHLAVHRDGRHPALQAFGKDFYHLDVASGLLRARTETFVAGLDPGRMRTDRALVARVSRTPDRLPELILARVLLRQAQWIAHPLRLPPDRGRDGDQLGLDVLEGLEFQHRVGRHSEVLAQHLLVCPEGAEARARAGDFQRSPHPGGGIDLHVDLKRSADDTAVLLERVQALACLLDILGAWYSPQHDSGYPGKYRRFELGRRSPAIDPDENLSAASRRVVYGGRHPRLQVLLPIPVRPPREVQDDGVRPGAIGFFRQLRVLDSERVRGTAYVPGHLALVCSLAARRRHALCRKSLIDRSHLFRRGTNAPGKSHQSRFAGSSCSTFPGRDATARARHPERAQRLFIEQPGDYERARHQETVQAEFPLGHWPQPHRQVYPPYSHSAHSRARFRERCRIPVPVC